MTALLKGTANRDEKRRSSPAESVQSAG